MAVLGRIQAQGRPLFTDRPVGFRQQSVSLQIFFHIPKYYLKKGVFSTRRAAPPVFGGLQIRTIDFRWANASSLFLFFIKTDKIYFVLK